jgi:AraC-like DNA-binding protein
MVAVVRALSIMRLGNALQSGALIFKIILNFSGAALIIVTGAELPTAYKAVALFMVFLQFLNPVALTIYFTPPQAGTGLRTISVGFAVVMMPLLLWYLAMDAQWTVSHPLPVWLFEFSLDHPGDFGAWSILYKIITPTVLAVLIYQQISHYWSRSQGFVKHKLWEIFYLTNGLVRALILVAVLEIASTSITSIFTVLSAIMGLSLLVDTGIILIFATNRAVQFHRDYGLSLRGSWSAQLEQIVYTAAKPEHYLKPKFTLADLSEAAGIPSYLVTRIVNKGTGLQVKELMNHFRVRHYETLVRNHPNERKKVLLAQSGFNSYASYYAARK